MKIVRVLHVPFPLTEQLTNMGYEQSVCARVRGVALHVFKFALYVLVCIAAYLWCVLGVEL